MGLRRMPGEAEGKGEKWLASAESPLTREQRHFTDLESLFAFLRTMTGQPPAAAHASLPFRALPG